MYHRELESIKGAKAEWDKNHKAIAAKRLAELAAKKKAAKKS